MTWFSGRVIIVSQTAINCSYRPVCCGRRHHQVGGTGREAEGREGLPLAGFGERWGCEERRGKKRGGKGGDRRGDGREGGKCKVRSRNGMEGNGDGEMGREGNRRRGKGNPSWIWDGWELRRECSVQQTASSSSWRGRTRDRFSNTSAINLGHSIMWTPLVQVAGSGDRPCGTRRL